MSTFQAPAILTRISFLADGGLNLGFHTNELSVEDKVAAARYQGKFGYVLFKENQFSEEEIPQTDAPKDDDKTPAQRLRAVLYVLWRQRGGKSDFESFYRVQVDKAIERVKALLD